LKEKDREIYQYFGGSLLLNTTDPPTRVRGRVTLASFRHHIQPNWVFLLRSTHPAEEYLQWLVAKYCIGRLGNSERTLMIWIASSKATWSRLLFLLERDRKNLDPRLFRGTNHFLLRSLELLPLALRILHGYKPEVFAYRSWSPQKLPEVRRIGVGYKDKGHLSSAPSWKDQIVFTEDDDRPAEGFLDLILHRLSSESHAGNPD